MKRGITHHINKLELSVVLLCGAVGFACFWLMTTEAPLTFGWFTFFIAAIALYYEVFMHMQKLFEEDV